MPLFLSLGEFFLLITVGAGHEGSEHRQLIANLGRLAGAHTARAQQPLQPRCLRLEPVRPLQEDTLSLRVLRLCDSCLVIQHLL